MHWDLPVAKLANFLPQHGVKVNSRIVHGNGYCLIVMYVPGIRKPYGTEEIQASRGQRMGRNMDLGLLNYGTGYVCRYR